MRRKKVKAGMTLLLGAALLILAGCPQEVAEEPSEETAIRSVSIDGDVLQITQAGTPLEEWSSPDFDETTMDTIRFPINPSFFDSDGELKDAVIDIKSGSGAEIWYNQQSGGKRPADNDPGWTKENVFDLKVGDTLYIQIVSANKKVMTYYRVQILAINNNGTLKALRIGGVDTGISPGSGAGNLTDLVLGNAVLTFGTHNIDAKIVPVKSDAGAALKYQVVKAGGTVSADSFIDTDQYTLDDGDTVYVKVIPLTGEPVYYGAVISTRRISVLNIGGTVVAVDDNGAKTLAGLTPVDDIVLLQQTMTNTLTVVKSSAAQVEYAFVSPGADPASAFVPLTDETAITWSDGDLYVKVKAEGFDDVFYKVGVSVRSNNRNIASVSIDLGGGVTIAATDVGLGMTTTTTATATNTVNVVPSNQGWIWITTPQAVAMAGKNVTVTLEDPQAQVLKYAVGNLGSTMVAWGTGFDSSVSNQFAAALNTGVSGSSVQTMYILVQAGTGDLWAYRLELRVMSNDATLSAISVGGRTVSNPTSDPISASGAASTATAPTLGVTIGNSTTESVGITVTKVNNYSRQAFGRGASPSGDSFFQEYAAFNNVVNNDILWVRSTSYDETVSLYYKIQVSIKSDDVTLTGIKIGTISVTDPGSGQSGMNVTFVNQASDTVVNAADMTANASVTVNLNDPGARVTGYMIVAANYNFTNPAPVFTTVADAATVSRVCTFTHDAAITDGQHLIIRVAGEDDSIWYYRVPVIQGDIATLTSVTVDGISGTLGTPDTVPASVTKGTITIDPAVLAAGAQVVAVKTAAASTVKYAVTAAAATPASGDFGTSDTLMGITNTDVIWLQVISQNESVTNYYGLTVEAKQNIATLASASLDIDSLSPLPDPAATWAAAEATIYSYDTPIPASVVLSAIAAAGSNATVQYGSSASENQPTWGSSGTFNGLSSGNYIGVKVTAENGVTAQYYKWRVSYGNSDATLVAAPAIYIAGVPNASNGVARSAYNGSGITSGAIYLNSTQSTIGKSIVVNVTDPNVLNVAFSTTNTTTDAANPAAWAQLTRDSSVPTRWTGTWSGTALANNRRFYIRVTAENAEQLFYRFLVTYQANYTVPSAITIGGSAVAAANRGTPAGSWNAADLAPGLHIMSSVPDPLAVSVTWNTGGTNTASYAVTATFPPASEPSWESSASLAGVQSGNYIWIRGVNSTNSNNSYRNIYVIKVGPPPFTVTVASQALEFADLGSTIAATGNTNVGGNPTPMGKIFLTEAQMASVAVSATPASVGDSIKVISYRIPESGGTTINTTAQASDFTSAASSGTFNLADTYPTRGLPVLQFQYTPQGSSTSTYYNLVVRKTQDIPFAATPPVLDGESDDAVWATAPEITIDRVATDTTTSGVAAATDRGRPAKVKILWDNTGIYYYARVYDSNIGTSGTDYNRDCIEFFKHEGWTAASTGNTWNGQYRIDASLTGSTLSLSGDANNSNTTGFLKLIQGTDVAEADRGYIIEAKINWSTAAATVAGWSTGGTDKEIGIEFQIAYSIASTRNVCMSWNNRFGGNYQQAANAGRLVLKRP
jgi:hypothetical protein